MFGFGGSPGNSWQPRSAQRNAGRWAATLLALGLMLAGPAQGQRIRYDEWRLEWAEEFDQPGDSTRLMPRWRFEYPWGRNLSGNTETQYYTGSQLHIADGQLHIAARRVRPRPYRGRQLAYESGMLFSHYPAATDSLRLPAFDPASNGFSYGLFEIRCRQPRDAASFPAFWLFGATDEVDIFEATPTEFSNNAIVRNGGFWRAGRAASEATQCFFFSTDPRRNLSQAFHTYGLAWRPHELVFYFDGRPIRRETRLVPLGSPMALIANLAILNWAVAPADTLAIDYIRVYRPRRRPAAPPVVQRPGGGWPQWDLAWLPFNEEPGSPDPAARQQWQAVADSAGHLRLDLLDNLNPENQTSFALPRDSAATWAPAWVLRAGSPVLRLRLAPGAPVNWELYDQVGELLRDGVLAAGTNGQLPWATLLPGSYCLRLRQGPARGAHRVVVLGRAPRSEPSAEWQQPVPVPE